jgi:hypothetical protein
MSINDREYWSGSTKWTFHWNWQRMSHWNKAVKLLSILINTLWTHRSSAFTKDVPVIKIRVAHLVSVLCSPIVSLQTTGGKERTNHRLYAEIKTRNPKRKDTIGEHKTLTRWATQILMTGTSFVKALLLWVQSVFINIVDPTLICLYISSFYFMHNFVVYEINFEHLIGFSVFSNISSNWS